jgi:GntR family transcriptional regulator, transcriptional repressor for pyruvate dehydrogenase complex
MEKIKVQRSLLSDGVIEAIQNQIIEGKLKPGDQLPSEKKMCEIFSVGRSTLREAIKALVMANFLEKKRNGTFVKEAKDHFFKANTSLILKQIAYRDLLEVRKILEVKIAGLSAERATAEDLNNIESIVQKMSKSIENNRNWEYIKEDMEFHQAIASSTNNPILLNQILIIRELFKDLYSKLLISSVLPRCHKHHCQIFEAIRNSDINKAEEFMAAHLDDVEQILNEEITKCIEDRDNLGSINFRSRDEVIRKEMCSNGMD